MRGIQSTGRCVFGVQRFLRDFAIILYLLFFSVATWSDDNQQRFEQIIQELRCLVCQNQSIADSNAPLAKDLRQEVYKKIQEGANNQAIRDYLVERYGQFILFKPAFNANTWILWLFPFLFLIVGFVWLIKNKCNHSAHFQQSSTKPRRPCRTRE